MMKFTFEKKLTKSLEKRYILRKYEGIMKREEVPREYLEQPPYIYLKDNGIVFETEDWCNILQRNLQRNSFSEKEFTYLVENLKTAGERLAEIRRRLKKEAEDFEGIIEVLI